MQFPGNLTNKSIETSRVSIFFYCHLLTIFFVTFSKVIGDKKGGVTSYLLIDPSKMSILEEINQVVQVPMKFIHITRNPFDNIATMMLRRLGARDDVREKGVKVSWCVLN